MSNFNLKSLIEKIVREELQTIIELKNKEKIWQKEEAISEKKLNSMFKVFHLSNTDLGEVFTFTPRTPQNPWDPIEDDFTERVSLAPSIEKAINAVNETRPFLYAGDIVGYGGDDVEALDLAKHIKNCPKSPGNKYGIDFDIANWIDHQIKTELDDMTPVEKKIMLRYGLKPPSELPSKYQKQFYGCVPDAKDTKELWAEEPVELIKIATFGNENRFNNYKGFFSLTEAGAKVVNAINKGKDTIPYG